MIILGAGLAGLLAGVLNQNADILEPLPKKETHRALLRFRSPDIGEAVGIPFKEVQVYKGIWFEGAHHPINPRFISLYSQKTSDKIAYRSICDVKQETRWIAPPDFQAQLEDICAHRIEYEVDIKRKAMADGPMISTLPIYVLADLIGEEAPYITKERKSIYVSQYRLVGCDAYMTNYFPAFTTPVYRASITANRLIVESMRQPMPVHIDEVFRSFGLNNDRAIIDFENFEQKNGKITPIDERWRKEFILNATLNFDVYSLGRFATWRNLVLDDVYKDILRIKRFIHKDRYDHHKDF